MSLFCGWRRVFNARRRFAALDRTPFYEIAARYLPEKDIEIAIDVGSGEGSFAEYLRNHRPYRNLTLLEANPKTITRLKMRYKLVIPYSAPDRLPFDDETVSYIHCSHLVEHLSPSELYDLIVEFDRVLKHGGHLIISTPLLWGEFYSDLSHKRPYNPLLFLGYLCGVGGDRTRERISDRYREIELVYRNQVKLADEEIGSEYPIIDFLIHMIKNLRYTLGIRRYIRNGYTLVLQKAVWMTEMMNGK